MSRWPLSRCCFSPRRWVFRKQRQAPGVLRIAPSRTPAGARSGCRRCSRRRNGSTSSAPTSRPNSTTMWARWAAPATNNAWSRCRARRRRKPAPRSPRSWASGCSASACTSGTTCSGRRARPPTPIPRRPPPRPRRSSSIAAPSTPTSGSSSPAKSSCRRCRHWVIPCVCRSWAVTPGNSARAPPRPKASPPESRCASPATPVPRRTRAATISGRHSRSRASTRST